MLNKYLLKDCIKEWMDGWRSGWMNKCLSYLCKFVASTSMDIRQGQWTRDVKYTIITAPDNDPTSFQTMKSEKVEHTAHNMWMMPRISHPVCKTKSMRLSPIITFHSKGLLPLRRVG